MNTEAIKDILHEQVVEPARFISRSLTSTIGGIAIGFGIYRGWTPLIKLTITIGKGLMRISTAIGPVGWVSIAIGVAILWNEYRQNRSQQYAYEDGSE